MVAALILVLLPACKIPKSSYTTSPARVFKVYSVMDGGHTLVTYVVERSGAESVVSDALGMSSHKVGDSIEYLDQKIEVDASTRALLFTLLK